LESGEADIPALWSSPTTTAEERQEILRLLIERVIVTVEGTSEKVRVEIHWHGGHKTYSNLIRPVAKLEQLSYYTDLIARAKELRNENKNFKEIADILNAEGWRPAKRQIIFNKGMVGTLLSRSGVNSHKKLRSKQIDRMANEWTFRELSQKINTPEPTLYAWMRKGMLQVRRANDPYGSLWLISADEQEIRRLQDLKNQPKQWIYRSKVKKVN
jgi:hypothetical protein